MNPRSNRREFLKGRSLVQAARQAIDKFEFDVPELSLDVEETKQAAYLESYETQAMACTWELMFNMQQFRQSGKAAENAIQLIDELESQLTIYDEQSEISFLNSNAYSQPIQLNQDIYGLIKRAKHLHETTHGAFDVTAGQLSAIWGFENRKGVVPSDDQLSMVLKTIGMRNVEFDDDTNSIRYSIPDLKINLGGIGKGYAIDRVASLIQEQGIADFIVHGGQSSVFAAGHQKHLESDHENGWPVGISHPVLPDRRLAEFYLRDTALGTSGTARQGFFSKGKRYGHIIHPKTGWPTDHFLSTTVISNSAERSDALATAFFVMPIEEVESWCKTNPDVGVVLVSETKGSERGMVQLEWFNISEDEWKRL